MWLTIGLGMAAMMAFAMSFAGGDRHAQFTGWLLIVNWVVTVVAWLLDSLQSLAVLDAITMLFCGWIAHVHPMRWTATMRDLAWLQLGLDSVFEWLGESHYMGYMVLYNLAFAGEILAVASTGWPNVARSVGGMWNRCLSRSRMVA